MMEELPRCWELDLALVAVGIAAICYGAQHEIGWLCGFGAIWAFGNFVKMLVKYG